jgi:FkbM family methyltransferase
MKNFVFDIGYHWGEGYDYLIRTYGIDENWGIFLFEPNSICIKKYNKRFTTEVFIPYACSNSVGENKFRRCKSNDGEEDGEASFVTGTTFDPGKRFHGDIEFVSSICFGMFINSIVPYSHDPHRNVVVKIDAEGSEYNIIDSMIRHGAMTRVTHLHVEFHDRAMDQRHKNLTPVLKEYINLQFPHIKLIDHW